MAPTAAVEEPNGTLPPLPKPVTSYSYREIDEDLIQTPLPNPCLETTADHQLKQVEGPVRNPRKGEVLLHVKTTGICGYVHDRACVPQDHGENADGWGRSDVHFWKSGRIGTLVFEGDCTLGHEAAGVVLKCGDGVTNFTPGMSVPWAVHMSASSTVYFDKSDDFILQVTELRSSQGFLATHVSCVKTADITYARMCSLLACIPTMELCGDT